MTLAPALNRMDQGSSSLRGARLNFVQFSAAAAIERLGVAVGGPVCFSCMLICGSVGDYVMEGSAHPVLLWSGILGCLAAVVADSRSHPSSPASPLLDKAAPTSTDSAAVSATRWPEEVPSTDSVVTLEVECATDEGGSKARATEPPCAPPPARIAAKAERAAPEHAASGSVRLGMLVAVGGGLTGGLWTVLSTLASRVHPVRPTTLLFYFHLGELVAIVPVVLAYGRLLGGGATTARELWGMARGLDRRQLGWTAAAGACIAIGYVCYFATAGLIPRAVAYGFGCAAGSLGMVWGLLVFHEYAGATWRKRALLLFAMALYPSSIALIAASMA
jgi:hypothetical protein